VTQKAKETVIAAQKALTDHAQTVVAKPKKRS
jgi:hypothetical protein